MRRLVILTLMLCLSACGYRGLGGSFVGSLPGKNGTTVIAEDAATYLAQEYAPGHTTFFMLPPGKEGKSAHNDFSMALDTALRARGFTLAAEGSGEAITLSYTLDALKDENGDENAWYLQLRLSDGLSVARAYGPDGSPEAGRSSAPLDQTFLGKVSDKASVAVHEGI